MEEQHMDAVEAILREWIADPDITLICGRWADGSIMELVPAGRARISPARYDGCFSGLRDLAVDGGGHHLHLDLARLSHAAYVVAPSVCFGYRPSFELRLARDAQAAREAHGLALAMRRPYRGRALQRAGIARYFSRLLDHRRRFPQVVSFSAEFAPPAGGPGTRFDWDGLSACLARVVGGARAVSSGAELQAALEAAIPAPAVEVRV